MRSVHPRGSGTGVLPALLAMFVLLAAELAPWPAWADSRFEAHGLDDSALVFTGRTVQVLANGLISERTVFVGPSGSVLQTVELTYDEASLRPVAYRKVDARDGESEGMAEGAGRLLLTYRATADDDEDTEALQWESGMLAPESMPERIRRDLERIAAGETLYLQLLVPSRLGTVGFRARWEGETDLDGERVAVVRAEPSFWLFRQFLPPLLLYYTRAAPHRLLEYRGRTSVKTDDGDPIYARIAYHPLPAP